jgi:hypothetical protein
VAPAREREGSKGADWLQGFQKRDGFPLRRGLGLPYGLPDPRAIDESSRLARKEKRPRACEAPFTG